MAAWHGLENRLKVLSEAIARPEWMADAACRGLDPDLFFPHAHEYQKAREAKAICERCEVKDDCLNYALTTNQKDGIWGGLTERRRRAARRGAA